MSAIVGIDAKVELSTAGAGGPFTEISERNEFVINIRVDTAERKIFVATYADAWTSKTRTWMSWSGSLRGYYDDADDTIFNTVVAGATIHLRFYDSRASARHWLGAALLTSVEKTTGTEDYITLSVDFEGSGALTRNLS